MKESKADRFRRVAEARVNKIIKMIRLLGNCSGTGVYEYTDTQVAYIFSALQSELDKAKRRFRKPLLGKHRFSLTDALSMLAHIVVSAKCKSTCAEAGAVQ